MKRVGAETFVAWVLKYGRSLWIVALIGAVPALVRAEDLYAHLRSEVEQLLPDSAPSVAAIRELRARMPGMQYLGIVVDSGSAANLPAGERLLDDLAGRVRRYPRWLVRDVRTDDALRARVRRRQRGSLRRPRRPPRNPAEARGTPRPRRGRGARRPRRRRRAARRPSRSTISSASTTSASATTARAAGASRARPCT